MRTHPSRPRRPFRVSGRRKQPIMARLVCEVWWTGWRGVIDGRKLQWQPRL